MPTILVALGSNIEPERNLAAAVQALRRLVEVLAVSPVYRTPPWGYADQAPFLNAVVRAQSTLEPLALLDALQHIERQQGRVRSFANAPRTLDLDLLDYDGLVLESPRLILPHPRLHERAFVLVPLCDLAPDWRHPVLGLTARELLARADRTGIEPTALRLDAEQEGLRGPRR